MIKHKTEIPLKHANIFMNLHLNLNFKLKTLSDVIDTHLEKKFLK